MKIPSGCFKKHAGGDAKLLIKFNWPYTNIMLNALPIIIISWSLQSWTQSYFILITQLTVTATNLCCFNFELNFTAPFSHWYCNWFHTSIFDLSVQHYGFSDWIFHCRFINKFTAVSNAHFYTQRILIIVAKGQSDV